MAAEVCAAQTNTFLLKVSNSISPQQPSARLELWAVFEPSAFAVANVQPDLLATPDEGGFSDPIVEDREMFCDFTSAGEVSLDGDRVEGISATQIHANFGCFASPDNPYLILSYKWSTDDFAPRVVDVTTLTHKFDLYLRPDGGETGDFLNKDFAEGSGQITIVPSPAGAVLIAMGVLLASRRVR